LLIPLLDSCFGIKYVLLMFFLCIIICIKLLRMCEGKFPLLTSRSVLITSGLEQSLVIWLMAIVKHWS